MDAELVKRFEEVKLAIRALKKENATLKRENAELKAQRDYLQSLVDTAGGIG